MYEEDHVDFYGTGSPRDIFFPKLPLGVKFTITSAMIKLLKLKACLNFQILMMQTNTQ